MTPTDPATYGRYLRSGSPVAGVLGPLLYIALALAMIAFYWPGITSLFTAWQKAEYSHGYIIPFIALFIALKRLPERSQPLAAGPPWAAIVTMTLAVLLGLFGRLSSIPDITTYGLLLGIAAVAFLIWGFRESVVKLWPAWVYLSFMLPLPNFIYWPLSIKLQFLSSEIGVAITKLLGVPVYLDGNIIDLGIYKLQVAEACSGLRYLFPLMSFGFLFSTLYRGPVWHKIIIFLSAIPITILMNSVRIGVIGFLVDRYGIAQAEGFLHFFEGWIIFAICIALLFLLAMLLQQFSRHPQSVLNTLDVETHGLLEKLNRFAGVTPRKATGVILALLAVVWVASETALTPKQVIPERERLDSYPMNLAAWSGERTYLDFDIERVLGADDYMLVDYQEGADKPPINFLVAYYKAQTEGSGIHSPEVCIPGGGWEVSKWEQAEVHVKGKTPQTFNVNRAIIQKGVERQLVYYWFEGRGRRLTNDYVAKGYTVFDSIRTGRTDGALVRVITPLAPKETIADAGARLEEFLSLALEPMPQYLPL